MKHLITLLFLMVGLVGFSQTDLDSLSNVDKFEKVEYYGDNGVDVRELINLDWEGRRHGTCYSFHSDGSLWGIAIFKHGKKHGDWKIYNKSGALIGEYYYKKDKRIGDWKMYDESGGLVAQRTY